VGEFDKLIDKERTPKDEIVLKNAMNRMLTMEMIGKKFDDMGFHV
jgi:hypothetical protein